MLCDVCIGMGVSLDELFDKGYFAHSQVEVIDGIKKERRVQGQGYHHHNSISNLIDAAKAGCELCQILLNETKSSKRRFITTLDLDDSQIYARVLDDRSYKKIHDTSMIIFYQSNPQDPLDIPGLSTILGVYALPDDPASKLKFIRGELVERELSTTAYAKAKTWIENCINSHPRCRGSADFFPPRVIDVGPSDGSEEPRLLIDGKLRAPWVALSHCWGGSISSATVHTNIHARTETLPMSNLPVNFQDAITITRELDYRYLWIDALCILQDSQFDWQDHLPYMGYIYQYAALTIAADVASDSDIGIILRREQADFSVPVPYKSLKHGVEGTVYFRPPLDVNPSGHIQTRGWTLQEDLLSVRTLYFSADQLLWQCQTIKISEGDHDPPNYQGRHEVDTEAFLKRSFLLLDSQPSADLDDEPPQTYHWNPTPAGKALDHWYLIVNEYVKRNLTVEQDRFPALSGIAKQIERRTGYQYVAGLWAEDIHVGLLWSAQGVGLQRQNIDCPSWSWASTTFPDPGHFYGPYQIGSGPRSLMKKLLYPISMHGKALIKDIHIDATNSDVYSGIRSGTVTVEAKFQAAKDWLSRYSQPLLYKKGQRFDLSDLIVPRPYMDPLTDSPHIICELDHHDHWPDNWTEENRTHFEAEVAFLQIYRLSGSKDEKCPPFHREYENLSIAYALILESTGKEGEYRRRGIAEIPCERKMADEGWDVRTVKII